MSADMLEVYAGADVFVMSSHFDPYPNTVSEAMASGCPVVLRRTAPPRVMIGIHEMVDGTPGCLTYGTDDVEELARHLDTLAEDGGRLKNMSEAAADWAGTRDWSRIIPEYLPNGHTAEGKA
jgi:glycosyltransferase involved in cell wall biosynthesis